MSNPDLPPAVSPDEQLARFVLFSKWIRPSDSSLKPDAFIPRPSPHLDLSVTRHIGLKESELWQLGRAVATARPATLYGRADLLARVVTHLGLQVQPTPTPRNHANILGWPPDKPMQKMLAQELAATAKFVPAPSKP